MCIAVLALGVHEKYPFVMAHNRDEFYARPSAPLARWTDAPWTGGRDLKERGTWLAFADDGRFSFVTNFRDPQSHREDLKSRGELVTAFLEGRDHVDIDDYNAFNLVTGRIGGAVLFRSSRETVETMLGPGIHVISNGLLEDREPWPKVTWAKKLVEKALSKGNLETALFAMLKDETKAPDSALPKTGLSPERERLVSSIFIRSADYGTRASTVILADKTRNVTLVERTFGANGTAGSEARATLPSPR